MARAAFNLMVGAAWRPLAGTPRLRRQPVAIAFLALLLALAACARLTAPQQYDVFFPTNEATLTPEAQKVVADAGAKARDSSPSKIIVEGQADGGTAHDATLADERAGVVVKALVAAGADSGTIEKRPSAPPKSATGVAAHKVIVQLLP